MNSTVAKIAGWLQFVGQLAAQTAAGGLPTSTVGWIAFGSSLAAAIGIHAAATTDGTK